MRLYPPSLRPFYRQHARPLAVSSRGYVTQPWSHPPTSANIADDEVARLASRPLHHLTLADLVRHGRPPLSPAALLESANFTLSLLPNRLAHRIHSLRNLPYIVVSNPSIARIYGNYLHSLSTLLPYTSSPIDTLEDEERFTGVLEGLVETHANTIPVLARGFLECRRYMSGGEVTKFLDEHLRARIGTRLIAEQHIALHNSSIPHDTNSSPSSAPGGELYIGIIDTKLSPRRTILSCAEHVSSICDLKYGVRPSLVIDGQPETTFAHVPVHLEYIVTELLKNAFRATVESGREGGGERAEVVVTIAKAPDEDDGDLSATGVAEGDAVSNNKKSTSPGITIRIRDRGGGIHPDHLPNIWSYSFTTYNGDDLPPSSSSPYSSSSSSATSSSTLPSSTSSVTASSFPISSLSNLANLASTNSSSIAGLGYGLPLSRAYAEYFGGSIGVQSMWGWGTDVYLNLKGVGRGVL